MASARFVSLIPLFAACAPVMDWREMQSGPMTIGECYDGLEFVATRDGFRPDLLACDRGLGTWQSMWRDRTLALGRPGRFRLRAEVLLDEGSPALGWPLRFAIEQQKVEDLRKSLQPTEDDWSRDGQYRDREVDLAEKLVRRLAGRPR